MEDSAPVFPLNTSDFSISDQDNVFLLQSILKIQNTGKKSAWGVTFSHSEE